MLLVAVGSEEPLQTTMEDTANSNKAGDIIVRMFMVIPSTGIYRLVVVLPRYPISSWLELDAQPKSAYIVVELAIAHHGSEINERLPTIG